MYNLAVNVRILYVGPCLRLVEDSEGLRLSLRGVQGVAAGVPNRVLVITQEDDAGTGFRLEGRAKRGTYRVPWNTKVIISPHYKQAKLQLMWMVEP